MKTGSPVEQPPPSAPHSEPEGGADAHAQVTAGRPAARRFSLAELPPAVRIGIAIVAGQALVYASLPLLARLYSAGQMGEAGIFLALASVVGAASTLRLEARVAGVGESTAAWLIRMGAFFALIVSILSAVAVTLVLPEFDAVDGMLFAITTAGIGLIVVATQRAARASSYAGVAASKVGQGAGQSVTQVVAGLRGATSVGMQMGFAVGYAAAAALQWFRLRPSSAAPAPVSPPAEEKRGLVRAAAVLTAATVLNTTALWAPLLVLRVQFTPADVGRFTIAQRLAVIPAALVVASLTPVITGHIGRCLREGVPAWPTARRYLLLLLPGAVLAAAALVAVPESWILALLGQNWVGVKGYLVALAPFLAAQLVAGPISQALGLVGSHRMQLGWDAARLATVVAAMLLTGLWLADPVATVAVGSVGLMLFYAAQVALVRRATLHRGDTGSPDGAPIDPPSPQGPNVLVLPYLADYRAEFLDATAKQLQHPLFVVHPSRPSDPTVRTATHRLSRPTPAPRSVLGGRLEVQPEVVRTVLALRPRSVIVEADVRVVSYLRLLIACRTRGIPVAVWGLGRYNRPRSLVERMLGSVIVSAQSNLVQGVLGKGQAATDYYAARMLRRRGKRILVAPNSTGLEGVLSTLPAQRSAPPAEQITLLFVGRLIPAKNLEMFLRALAAAESRSRFRLLVVGDGPERPVLTSLVDALGLTPQVDFLGNRSGDDLVDVFRRSDVLILPGKGGLVVPEGFAAGLPLLAAPLKDAGDGTLDDIVQDGTNAVIAQEYSQAAFSAAIDRLAAEISAGRWPDLSAAASAAFGRRGGVGAMADAFVEVYDDRRCPSP